MAVSDDSVPADTLEAPSVPDIPEKTLPVGGLPGRRAADTVPAGGHTPTGGFALLIAPAGLQSPAAYHARP